MRRARRKWFAVCAAMAFLLDLMLHSSAPLMAGPRSVIAVLDLMGGGLSYLEVVALSDGLRAELHAAGEFSVVDSERMADALIRADIVDPAACDDACALRVGAMVGADRVLVGHAVRRGDHVLLRLRMLDVQRGSLLTEVERTCRADVERILGKDVPSLVEEIVRERAGGRFKMWMIGLGVGVVSVVAYVVTQGEKDTSSPGGSTPLPEPPSRP